MLPAARRLTDSREFASTVRRGARTSTPLLVLHVAGRASSDEVAPPHHDAYDTSATVVPLGRVGFVVSKAVGNAVTRNRVRRRLRHAVGGRLDLVADGTSVVVRALPRSASVGSAELAGDLTRALERGSASALATSRRSSR